MTLKQINNGRTDPHSSIVFWSWAWGWGICILLTLGYLTTLFCPHSQEFVIFGKNAHAQRLAWGAGGWGWGWGCALLKFTDANNIHRFKCCGIQKYEEMIKMSIPICVISHWIRDWFIIPLHVVVKLVPVIVLVPYFCEFPWPYMNAQG